MRRFSASRGRRLTRYEQAAERFAASRAGAWLFLHLLNPADRRLLRLTAGRVSITPRAPVGLLETRGARSGRPRRAPLLFLADGDAIVIVASNGGASRHPGWLHNVRADPEVRFLAARGGWRRYRATEATTAERTRLWPLLTDLYAGYAAYQERTGGRTIPVVVLTPASPATR